VLAASGLAVYFILLIHPSEDLKELGHSFNLAKYKTSTRAQTKQKALLLPKEQGNDQLCSQSLINAKISPATVFQNSLAAFQIKTCPVRKPCSIQ